MTAPTIRVVEGRRYVLQVLTLTGAPGITGPSGKEFHPTILTVEILARPRELVRSRDLVRAVTLSAPGRDETAIWSDRAVGTELPLADLPPWVRPIVEPLFPELHHAAPRKVDAP